MRFFTSRWQFDLMHLDAGMKAFKSPFTQAIVCSPVSSLPPTTFDLSPAVRGHKVGYEVNRKKELFPLINTHHIEFLKIFQLCSVRGLSSVSHAAISQKGARLISRNTASLLKTTVHPWNVFPANQWKGAAAPRLPQQKRGRCPPPATKIFNLY